MTRFLPILPGVVLLLSLFGAGCNTVSEGKAPRHAAALGTSTGRVLTRDDVRQNIPGLIMGDRMYAEVNSKWLREWYGTFRAELFRLGIVRWDGRFDCNRFADVYAGMAQTWFFKETFHSDTPAQALALGPYWYLRADGSGGHAVVQALTERGRVFIDPQTGKELELSAHERMTAFLQYF